MEIVPGFDQAQKEYEGKEPNEGCECECHKEDEGICSACQYRHIRVCRQERIWG
mgnify:CR=1 FL=1